MPKKLKKEKKCAELKTHKLIPIHLFENKGIDRWIILTTCGRCAGRFVFTPMDYDLNPCQSNATR